MSRYSAGRLATQCRSCDKTECALLHNRACTVTRSGMRYDTVGGALRHGQVRPATRHMVRVGQAKVGCTMHSTQFWLSPLFSVTVHEHCSRGFQKKNQIKSNLLKMKFSKIKFLLLKMI